MVLLDAFNRGAQASPFSLEGHTADNGSTWTRTGSTQAGAVVISPNGCIRPGVLTSVSSYQNSTPGTTLGASANYDIAYVVTYSGSNDRSQVIMRYDGTNGAVVGMISTANPKLEIINASGYGTVVEMILASVVIPGRRYYIVANVNGSVVSVGMKDLVTNLWLGAGTGSAPTFNAIAFNSATKLYCLSATVASLPATAGIGLLFFGGATLTEVNSAKMDQLHYFASGAAPEWLPVETNTNTYATNSNLLKFDGNWAIDATKAYAVYPGSKLEMVVNGSTQIVVGIDTSVATLPPWVYAEVDGVVNLAYRLPSGATSITIDCIGLGQHYVRLVYAAKQNYTNAASWVSSSQQLRITSVSSPDTLVAIAGKATGIFFGDSITEGLALNTGLFNTANGFCGSIYSYAHKLGQLLGIDFDQAGCGSQGWFRNGVGDWDTFLNTWNLKVFGVSRTLTNYNYIFVCQGTNDALNSTIPTATDVQTWISSARTAAPNARIFIIVPFGQYAKTNLIAGVTAYKTANPSDTRVTYIDLGIEFSTGLDGFANGANIYSIDGIHPTVNRHTQISQALLAKVNEFLQVSIADTNKATWISAVKRSVVKPASGSALLELTGGGGTSGYGVRFNQSPDNKLLSVTANDPSAIVKYDVATQFTQPIIEGGYWRFFQASAPLTRTDGSALVKGDFWRDTVNLVNYDYSGSAWVDANGIYATGVIQYKLIEDSPVTARSFAMTLNTWISSGISATFNNNLKSVNSKVRIRFSCGVGCSVTTNVWFDVKRNGISLIPANSTALYGAYLSAAADYKSIAFEVDDVPGVVNPTYEIFVRVANTGTLYFSRKGTGNTDVVAPNYLLIEEFVDSSLYQSVNVIAANSVLTTIAGQSNDAYGLTLLTKDFTTLKTEIHGSDYQVGSVKPTLRANGTALQTGDVWIRSTDGSRWVYNAKIAFYLSAEEKTWQFSALQFSITAIASTNFKDTTTGALGGSVVIQNVRYYLKALSVIGSCNTALSTTNTVFFTLYRRTSAGTGNAVGGNTNTVNSATVNNYFRVPTLSINALFDNSSTASPILIIGFTNAQTATPVAQVLTWSGSLTYQEVQ